MRNKELIGLAAQKALKGGLEEHFTKEDLVEMFQFLDGLRDSGVVNMFGAAPYLEENFFIGVRLARKVLQAWMETYGKETE